jgi:hypothetical protein
VHAASVGTAGDEVVDPSTTQLGPGQIRDCNRAMLLAAAATAGADTIDLGIARDVEGHLEGAVDKAIAVGADVLVTSGGTLREGGRWRCCLAACDLWSLCLAVVQHAWGLDCAHCLA